MKKSIIQTILDKYDIDETFTTVHKPRDYKYPKVKDQIPPLQDYNYMADLLHLPESKKGNKYLLVVIDLWSNEIEIEPIKDKTSESTLKALLNMFKRPFLKKPKASIATDAGTEFKNQFHSYLYDNNIYHKVAMPGRHKQQSSVERANRTIGRILNGYMNKKEKETGKVYREWDEIVNSLRKLLNENPNPDQNPYTKKYPEDTILLTPSKYNVGDYVYHILEEPENALGHKQNTKKFREGDYRFNTVAKKVIQVLPYGDQYRYMIDGIKNVAYAEWELKKADESVDKYVIKRIINKRKTKGQIEYLIWWKNYLKKDSTWENKAELIKDGAIEYINEYEKSKA